MSDKFISNLTDYPHTTNKCRECGKRYKLPNFIYHPREHICFTCEVQIKTVKMAKKLLHELTERENKKLIK